MQKRTININQFTGYFANYGQPISLNDIRRYFRGINPDISDSTVNWHAHEMVKASILTRVGRGLFRLGNKKDYQPSLSELDIRIAEHVRKNFPLVSFGVWNSGLLNEFAQHISGYPFILVDTERDVAESVYLSLKEAFKPVFYKLDDRMFNELVPEFDAPVIVRHLVTESPLIETDGIPSISLEKLLVDSFCDAELSFLEGSELRAIFRNAFAKYTVNESRLLRYASRKGRKSDMDQFLRNHKING